MIKAWEVTVSGFTEVMYVFATTRSKAKFSTFSTMNEVGYKVKFGDIKVIRAKQFDCLADKVADRRGIGKGYIGPLGTQ